MPNSKVRGKEHGGEHWRVSAFVADRESLPLVRECTGIIIKYPYEFAFSSRPSQAFFRINPQNLRLFLIFYFNALALKWVQFIRSGVLRRTGSPKGEPAFGA
jgi:hypothetical protein